MEVLGSTSNSQENNGGNVFRGTALTIVPPMPPITTTITASSEDKFDYNEDWEDVERWERKIGGAKTAPLIEKCSYIKYLISKDVNTGGAKQWFFCDYDIENFIHYLLSIVLRQRNFYETFYPECRMKLFFDLDAHGKDITQEEMQSHIGAYQIRSARELERFFPDEYRRVGGITPFDWVVLDSSGIKDGKHKTSYHLVLATKFNFAGVQALREFLIAANFLGSSASPPRIPRHTENKGDDISLFDGGVYKANGSMRIAGSSKMVKKSEEPRILKFISCPGYTDEECKTIDTQGSLYYPDGVVPESDVKARKDYVNMVRLSMITEKNKDLVTLSKKTKEYSDLKKKEDKLVRLNNDEDPDFVIIPLSDELMLRSLVEKLVENDKNIVNDYEQWILMGRLLCSAKAPEQLWIDFSNMGDDPSPEHHLKWQWDYFGRQAHTKDPKFFYNFAKKRIPDAFAEVSFKSIEMMDSSVAEISKTLARLYSDKHIYDGVWFYKVGHIWKKDANNTFIGKTIMEEFLPQLRQVERKFKQEITTLKGSGEAELDEKKIAMLQTKVKTFKEIFKICEAGRINKDWFSLSCFFSKTNFSEELDSRKDILVFDNGIIDLSGSTQKDENGNTLYETETFTDENGNQVPFYDENGNEVKIPLKASCEYNLRQPELYTNEHGNPTMEYVSKTTGYNYYSRQWIYTEGHDNYRKQYIYWGKYWKRCMNELFPNKDLRNYVLLLLATCLDGDIQHQKFWIWTGLGDVQQGSNGKSVLKELILKILGAYGITVPSEIFTHASSGAGNANSALMQLKGARIAFADEPDAKKGLNVPIIKKLTGGDEISARELYSSQETFKNMAKLHLITNEQLMPSQTDDGWWRRARPLPFAQKFVDDIHDPKYKDIDVKPKDNDILNKATNWRLFALHDLLEILGQFKTPRGEFFKIYKSNGTTKELPGLGREMREPQLMKDALAEYMKGTNDIKDWLNKILIEDPQGVVSFEDLNKERKKTPYIKDLFRKERDFATKLSSGNGGQLGPLYHHDLGNPKFHNTPAITPDGKKHIGVFKGWSLKQQEEEDSTPNVLGDD